MNFITGSVHIILRFTASWLLNMRRATLSLMITTFSLSAQIVGVEVAAGDDRHAERLEEAGRHGAEAGARIVFTIRLRVALGRELRVEERAGLAPRHDRADRHRLHARQLADLANRFAIERQRLLGRPLEVERHVNGEHVAQVDAGLGLLQRDQRRQQRAGAGQQHERRGDLRDREQPQPAVRAAGDAHAAARQAEARGRIGGRQPRNEREQHRRHQREADADPEQRAVDA